MSWKLVILISVIWISSSVVAIINKDDVIEVYTAAFLMSDVILTYYYFTKD
jgi:hypothetical protein